MALCVGEPPSPKTSISELPLLLARKDEAGRVRAYRVDRRGRVGVGEERCEAGELNGSRGREVRPAPVSVRVGELIAAGGGEEERSGLRGEEESGACRVVGER
jgi:hypothetical protein